VSTTIGRKSPARGHRDRPFSYLERKLIVSLPGQLWSWLTVAVIAVGLNVVPAFMPPTWSVLAYFHVREGLAVLPLAVVGALGATLGRAALALGSRAVGARVLPCRWRANIEVLVDELKRRRELGLSALALFALGPVPSNQLFIAAGIARAPLLPILAVFAVARFISYLIWINAGSIAATSLTELLSPRLGATVTTAIQIAGFIFLLVMMQLDWRRILQRYRG
jgi:membrane protein YqaA with SNARE-associated domain